MALNFLKKVFSFGRSAEDKSAQAVPEAEAPLAPPVELAPSPVPSPAETAAEAVTPPMEAAPAAEIAPPIRQPGPFVADPLREEIAPEPAIIEAPAVPEVTERARPAAGAAEPLAPAAKSAAEAAMPPAPAAEIAPAPPPAVPAPEEPQPETIEATAVETPVAPAAEAPTTVAPSYDIAPPLRQPEPFIADALREEIAPEPTPIPAPPAAGKVTVTKTVELRKEEAAPAPQAAPRQSWVQRLREGLSRSSRELTGNITSVFTKRKLDEDTLQDLEDVLLRADLGMETAIRITGALAASRHGRNVTGEEVRAVMAQEVEKVLSPVAQALELDLSHKPHVILVVGVNGTGKTTTIGKLAAKLTAGGLKVMLAAGDTFRAAAIEQLKIWGERTNSPVIASKLGADAAGLAYDAFEKAKAAGSDVLIIDTAGRLQNKTELMAELEKIVRVLSKLDPEAPHTVLQTVDATTGQNALNQVEIFRNVAGVNGLVMTKLDGTARGGILVAIAAKHKLPVYFIGVGEQVEDLEPFSAGDFARAIAGVA
jgi:fused signal recognition particle receptor